VFHLVADYHDQAVGILTVVMTTRKYKMYQLLFKKIQEIFPNFSPQMVMADYEAAMRKGLKTTFPDMRLLGCR